MKLRHEEILRLKPSIEVLRKTPRLGIMAILEDLRSLHNVGAIFRTADAVLLEKLYLCGYTGAPPRSQISKTALGAEEIVPFEKEEKTLSVIKKLKKRGVQIVALELSKKSIDYRKAEYRSPCCLVVGNEIEGISDKVLKSADTVIDIPMLGRANSLNVSTAFGIAIYEIFAKLYPHIENPYRNNP